MLKILLLLLVLFGTDLRGQDISSGDLKVGRRYWSPDRNYFVEFQSDGNLVVYTSKEVPVWDTKTNGKGAKSCVMQSDGNLVLYDGNTPIWNSETYGHSGTKTVLQMQNDGNLVIVACIDCYWIPLWSWMTGKWTVEQINEFPNKHPNGAKCCPPPPQPATSSPPSGSIIVNPRYSVDQKGTDWVIKFQTHSKIRHHSTPGFSPVLEMVVKPGDNIIVKPGQWIECWFYRNGNYVWSLATDADHR